MVGAHADDSSQTTITNGATASNDSSSSSAGAADVFLSTATTWAAQAYLKAPNAEAPDFFGISVSISGDNIVVGAYGEASSQTTITHGATASHNNLASYAGAAYVFLCTGTTWAAQAYLKAPNAGSGDRFGIAVLISGDSVVVGAYGVASSQTTITNGATASNDNSASSARSAYVFLCTGMSWAAQAYLKAPNAGPGDFFGRAVSISGDSIVVGAYEEDSSQTTITNGATASNDNSAYEAGAVYVFLRTCTAWAAQAYLKAPNAGSGDYFGIAVLISGDSIVMGAEGEDSSQTTITNGDTASNDNLAYAAGTAHLFVRTTAVQAYGTRTAATLTGTSYAAHNFAAAGTKNLVVTVDSTYRTATISISCAAATSGTLISASFSAATFPSTHECLVVIVDGTSHTLVLDGAECKTGANAAAKATAWAAELQTTLRALGTCTGTCDSATVTKNGGHTLVIASGTKGTGSTVVITQMGSGTNTLALFGATTAVDGVITGPTACAARMSIPGATVSAKVNGMLKFTSSSTGTGNILVIKPCTCANALKLFKSSGVPSEMQGSDQPMLITPCDICVS